MVPTGHKLIWFRCTSCKTEKIKPCSYGLMAARSLLLAIFIFILGCNLTSSSSNLDDCYNMLGVSLFDDLESVKKAYGQAIKRSYGIGRGKAPKIGPLTECYKRIRREIKAKENSMNDGNTEKKGSLQDLKDKSKGENDEIKQEI